MVEEMLSSIAVLNSGASLKQTTENGFGVRSRKFLTAEKVDTCCGRGADI